MIVGYSDLDDVLLSSEKLIELEDVFKDIMSEYAELTANKNVIKNYKLQFLITFLEFKYKVCTEAIASYFETDHLETLLIVNEYEDLKIDEKKDFGTEFNKLVSKVKSLKNRIRIHKINYEKKNKKNNKAIKFNLDREALSLEMSLKLSHSIEVTKTTVERWINMIELSKEREESYG